MKGNVEEVEMYYIIRDHDLNSFENRKNQIKKNADYLNEKYGVHTITVHLSDQYFNMKEKIQPHMHIIETAEKVMKILGITPIIVPIRGGTDGARLSYMGLPTPNLFTGGHNYHGRFEYIPTLSMEKAVQVIIKIIELYGQA